MGDPPGEKSLVEPQCHLIGQLYGCACSLLFTLQKNEFPQKLTDCIFNCNVAENVPAVCQKGRILKKQKVYVKYIYIKKKQQ